MSKKPACQASDREKILYRHIQDEHVTLCRNHNAKRILSYLLLEALVFGSLFLCYVLFNSRPAIYSKEDSKATCDHTKKCSTYLISSQLKDMYPEQTTNYVKDQALSSYNRIEFFTKNNTMMRKSKDAERFWMNLLQTDGVVSVPTQWALDLGLATSLENPDQPGHSIYQVDMYHSLHCLHHIRSRLVSKVSLEKWPRDDKHSLHCINYLRQQIMCHADITLGGTDDVLHYSLNKGHQCRDYDAVVRWTKDHAWPGHVKWIKENLGYEAGVPLDT